MKKIDSIEEINFDNETKSQDSLDTENLKPNHSTVTPSTEVLTNLTTKVASTEVPTEDVLVELEQKQVEKHLPEVIEESKDQLSNLEENQLKFSTIVSLIEAVSPSKELVVEKTTKKNDRSEQELEDLENASFLNKSDEDAITNVTEVPFDQTAQNVPLEMEQMEVENPLPDILEEEAKSQDSLTAYDLNENQLVNSNKKSLIKPVKHFKEVLDQKTTENDDKQKDPVFTTSITTEIPSEEPTGNTYPKLDQIQVEKYHPKITKEMSLNESVTPSEELLTQRTTTQVLTEEYPDIAPIVLGQVQVEKPHPKIIDESKSQHLTKDNFNFDQTMNSTTMSLIESVTPSLIKSFTSSSAVAAQPGVQGVHLHP